MKKSINIIYELAIFMTIIFFVQYEFRTGQISRATYGEFHIYWIHIISLLLLLSITSRVVIKGQPKRRFLSTFYFGFVVGSYIWSTYAVSEYISIDLALNKNNIFNLFSGVALAGLIFALLGTLISLFFEKIINKILSQNSS